MKLGELEKIIKQIRKYDLEEAILDIGEWIESLNEKQKKNFLSLDIECVSEFPKWILINWDFLNSNYYLADIELINSISNSSIMDCVASVAINKESLNSCHHTEDMKLIANGASSAYDLSLIAKNKESLASPYHRGDMELIYNSLDDEIRRALRIVACNEESLTSNYHQSDMNIISCAKNAVFADALADIATNEYSLDNELHTSHMAVIENAKSDKKAAYLSHIICSKVVMDYPFKDDSKLGYFDILNLVNNAKSDEVAKYTRNVTIDKNLMASNYYIDNIIFLGCAPNGVIAEKIYKVATNNISLCTVNHLDDIIDTINENSSLMSKKEILDYMFDLSNIYASNDLNAEVNPKILSIGRKK